MLSVRLLGSVQVYDGEYLLPPFPTQRSRELFAILASHPNHPHLRASLAGNLWPEKTEEKARASLNTELWRVRQVLGKSDDCLALTRDTAALNLPAEQVDIHRFRALIGRGDAPALQTAVALYRGDFLEGSYADWRLLEREQLADLFRSALEGLLRHHESRGECTEAIAYARRLAALDPLREEIHRALMRLHVALDDRPAALSQYQTCKSLLRRELDVAPMPETEALFQTIARLPEDAESSRAIVQPNKAFVGRARALQWLDAAWARVQAGQPRALIVAGEAGIGKTRLVEHWLSRLEEQAVILRGRCYETHRQEAFHPLREMLRAAALKFGAGALETLPKTLLAELSNLAPDLRAQLPRVSAPLPLPPAQARERLTRALALGLRAYAERGRPLLLFFDDLQWADAESFDLIGSGFQSGVDHPVLLIATYRPNALENVTPGALDQIARRLNADALLLEPLSQAETAELIRALGRLTDSPGWFAKQVYAETEGNPLFIVETLRGLFDAGYLAEGAGGAWAIPLDRQRVDAARLPIPASLRGVIRKRVECLTENQKRALNAAAVIGREFLPAELTAILGIKESACRDALRVLLRNGLIEEAQHGLAFSHARIQEFLRDALAENELRELHLQAAHFFEAQPGFLPERIAQHYSQAGEAGRALAFFEQAGERAMRLHAYKTAAAHFESALPLCEEKKDGLVRFRLLMNIYHCNWAVASDHGKMEKILEEAQALAETGGESNQIVATQYYFALNLVSQGQWNRAMPALERALEQAISNRCLEFEMKARQELSNLLQYMNRDEEARTHCKKALSLARKLKDVRIEQRARWDLASFEQSARTQAQLARKILERALQSNMPAIAIEIGSSAVTVQLRAGDPGAALAQAERLLAFGRENGIQSFVKTVQRALARALCEIGQYETAQELSKESLAASRLTAYRYGEMRALACLGLANAGLGDFDEALHCLAGAAQMCEQMNSRMDLSAARVEIACLLLRRGGAASLDAAESLARQILAEGFETRIRSWHVHALGCLARVRLAEGRLEEAREHSAQALALMESPANRDFSPDPRVYFVRFLVLKSLGDDSARDFLQRSRAALAGRAHSLPARLRRDFLRRVPAHREICAARER